MMNKKQWSAVINAYIWSVANSATDFNPDDMNILCDLLDARKAAPGMDDRKKSHQENRIRIQHGI